MGISYPVPNIHPQVVDGGQSAPPLLLQALLQAGQSFHQSRQLSQDSQIANAQLAIRRDELALEREKEKQRLEQIKTQGEVVKQLMPYLIQQASPPMVEAPGMTPFPLPQPSSMPSGPPPRQAPVRGPGPHGVPMGQPGMLEGMTTTAPRTMPRPGIPQDFNGAAISQILQNAPPLVVESVLKTTQPFMDAAQKKAHEDRVGWIIDTVMAAGTPASPGSSARDQLPLPTNPLEKVQELARNGTITAGEANDVIQRLTPVLQIQADYLAKRDKAERQNHGLRNIKDPEQRAASVMLLEASESGLHYSSQQISSMFPSMAVVDPQVFNSALDYWRTASAAAANGVAKPVTWGQVRSMFQLPKGGMSDSLIYVPPKDQTLSKDDRDRIGALQQMALAASEIEALEKDGVRIRDLSTIIKTMKDDGVVPAEVWSRLDAREQALLAAQLRFIDRKVYLESGKAVNKYEFVRGQRELLSMGGNEPQDVIDRKKGARNVVMYGMTDLLQGKTTMSEIIKRLQQTPGLTPGQLQELNNALKEADAYQVRMKGLGPITPDNLIRKLPSSSLGGPR